MGSARWAGAMTGKPAVSVVVPIHNAAPYLDACVDSVLRQKFIDFELVLYDDGSSDDSGALIDKWAVHDARVRAFHGEARLGAAGSSNRVVELARASLIARIDADDVMLPERLDVQSSFMRTHPEAALVGALAWTIDFAGRRVRVPDLARTVRASAYAPFPHSSVMFRRSAWEAVGGYRRGAEKWEDVDFFRRLAAVAEIWLIPQALIEYRQHSATTRLADGAERFEAAMDAMTRALAGQREKADGRIAPAAYFHIGAGWLWGGGRPRLLGPILERARLGFDLASLALLAWAAAAQIAPGALRGLLRARLSRQNRAARAIIGDAGAVRWIPGQAFSASPNAS